MSLRALWVVSLLPENYGKVLFLRTFSTVERRAQQTHGDSYQSIPPEDEFSTCLLLSLGLTTESKQHVEWRDKASRCVQLPIVAIRVGEKELWPILIIEQNSCLICCFPYIEKRNGIKNLLQNQSITMGFSVVIGILNFLGPSTAPKNELSSRFVELDNYLTLSMPFGTPSDTDPSSVIASYNLNSQLVLTKKQNAWKQLSSKGKSSISLEINEYVRSVQGDQPGFHSVVDIYGNVSVKAELDSSGSDVSVTLGHSDISQMLYLDSLIIHPCVQTYTATTIGAAGLPKRLWFTPPMHRFMLCYYRAQNMGPPVLGTFKMRGDTSIELLLQLKLNENVKNCFDSFEAIIPFFHRGPILHFEFKCTQGLLQMSDDKHSLKWNLGTKFSYKSLEAVLTAKIELSSEPLLLHNDPFCTGKNCYIQINFKQINNTLSGCSIDPKSITVSPTCKPKIFLERAVHSTEYRIWNHYGDLPFPLVVDKWQEHST